MPKRRSQPLIVLPPPPYSFAYLPPPRAEGGVVVVFVEHWLGHEHVAVGSSGVGVVTFFHNNNRVLQVAVYNVNLEVSMDCCLDPSYLSEALH